MNHREYIIKVISADVVEKNCRCKEIQQVFVDNCVESYDKSKYFDLERMILKTKEAILKYSPLESEVSAGDYADKLNISVPTARIWLSKMDGVMRNTEHKPYVYSL